MGSYSTVPAYEVIRVVSNIFLCWEYAEPNAHRGSFPWHNLVVGKLFMTLCQSTVERADSNSNSASVEMDAIFLKASDQASYEDWTTTERVNTNRNCKSHEGFVAARREGECD